jgi:5-methylcytosine-specific restriction protein B
MSSTRVFIAPRSGEQSSKRFKKTIEGGYQKTDLEPFFTAQDKEALADQEVLMVWGNKPKLKTSWEKMQQNDWVLFYQRGDIVYAGKLLYKTHNKELADNLWGQHRGENGELLSWEYVFFLKDLQKASIPYRIMADLAGYKGAVVQGFMPYSEKGIDNIIKKYGSLDSFFQSGIRLNNSITVKKMNLIPYQKINLSIKTKPLILLAGISGTGKSRLARILAYQFNNIESDRETNRHPPSNFQLIKVKPNWHDSSELLGYESRISGKDRYIVTDFMRFLVKAHQYPDTPFFVCLDEMNLAPVEHYFAEYLSAVETRRVLGDRIVSDSLISPEIFEKYHTIKDHHESQNDFWKELRITDDSLKEELLEKGLTIPDNLIVIGTVNMDETTHSFSRKVLDRAMTIEMNEINLTEGLIADTDDWSYPEESISAESILPEFTQGGEVYNELGEDGVKIIEYLEALNVRLMGTPFQIAYRVRDDFLLYAYNYSRIESRPDDWLKQVMDDMTHMKVLPRIEGDEDKTIVLDKLKTFLEEKQLDRSLKKVNEMNDRRIKSHFTSFWP